MPRIKQDREREFIRLLSLGVAPLTAAKEVGYGTGDLYRRAIRRMAERDMDHWKQEQERKKQGDDDQDTKQKTD